jgi:hypothetical protein
MGSEIDLHHLAFRPLCALSETDVLEDTHDVLGGLQLVLQEVLIPDGALGEWA